MSFHSDPLFLAAEVAWHQERVAKANEGRSARRGTHHRHLRFLNRRPVLAVSGPAPRAA
jgi:hypothetical protein